MALNEPHKLEAGNIMLCKIYVTVAPQHKQLGY